MVGNTEIILLPSSSPSSSSPSPSIDTDADNNCLESWTLELDDPSLPPLLGPVQVDLNGLPTVLRLPSAAPSPTPHPNRTVRIDHLVLTTTAPFHSLLETALSTRLGLSAPRKTIRSDSRGPTFRFYRIGELLLESLEFPPSDSSSSASTSSFWGITFRTDDIAVSHQILTQAALLREVTPEQALSPIRAAFQPHRSIFTVRQPTGLGTRIAFISAPPLLSGRL
ncbi:MAG: hypothetical protein Q8P67_25725 [archaeon]|nr:hypothetical protein [archaeon]